MKAWQVVRINELAADNGEKFRYAGKTIVHSYFNTLEKATAFYESVALLNWFVTAGCKIKRPQAVDGNFRVIWS